MERGHFKIYPYGRASTVSTVRPWHWSVFKYGLDPMVAIGAYFALLWAYGERMTGTDVALLIVMLVLLFPVEIPFRIFNARVALSIAGAWTRVAASVAALWFLSEQLGGRLQILPWMTVEWLLLTPLAMLLLHFASPRLVPALWRFYPQKKVVVVGANPVGLWLAHSLAERRQEGVHFAGYFDDRGRDRLSGVERIIGRLADVSSYVKANGIDAIYISLPLAMQPRVVTLLESLADTTASIHFLPDISVADPIQARVSTVAGLPVLSVCESPFDGAAGAIKRAFDLTLTICSLPLVIPLVLVIAALVRGTSPGPAFFAQRRYGLDGKEILVFKFRTMTTLEDGQATYTQVTREDSRVTPIGRFLRRTSLDEIPQLFNVLFGSMSLIGPRPHALAVNEQYRKLIPRYMVRHKVKPGITGWAQVNGCRGGNDLDAMRRRTEYDLAYLRSWSLWLDVLILFKTVGIMVRGDEHAY